MSFPSLGSRRPVSLWTRIVTLISLVLVLGTLLTGALSLTLLHRTLMQSKDGELRTGMQGMVSIAAADLNGDDEEGDDPANAPVDFVIAVHDDSGRHQVYRKDNYHDDSSVDLAFPSWTTEQVNQHDGKPFTLLDSDGNRWRVRAMVNDDASGGSVFVALPLDSVDRTMREMALVIVLVGTFVVLVGMGAGGYMAHRALEPLRDVEEVASQIVAGDLSRRVPVTDTSQEVNALAVSLNEMLVRLEQSFIAQADSEEKATSSEARMRRFVGDASHELRTPLAAIRGFGELYRMGALSGEENVSSAMRRIEDEARRMGSLVENLLRLARLDENPDVALEPLDVTDAIFDVAQDLRALDPSRQVMVVSLSGTPLSVSPHIPVGVRGDEPALRQVLLNLIGNTNRHTPKGSPVEIAVGRQDAGTVVIEVRDHGEGIAEDQREKVFERFYRTDESRQRSAAQGGGAGLGLSIAATIVQQHQGSIRVDETPGGGATFHVELQAADLSPEQVVEPDQVSEITQGDADPGDRPSGPQSGTSST
ncbi:histidine kinase [Brachybacterium endophyticum]|uniref:histidine kinase n=1 Tax=Brachybacterium endophyticum TaxID=2182385 RepID=A0A2U2RP92_9MICO|nr:HAMP domain-containing sensor histidine kinase [Brachybacterium endophyticum]PWH07651.1 histidine kinase [Brachybacterium endophyticum]